MADFTIMGTLMSGDVVTLLCKTPESGQFHEVRIHVADQLMAARGVLADDRSIMRAVRTWAEPHLRKAGALADVSELRMDNTKTYLGLLRNL